MRYRYFEDLYNHQYRWSTERSEIDGKFVACIYKYKTANDWGRYVLTKERRFNKRNMAKAWCSKNHAKAVERQRIVLNSREHRKEEREALKPVYTKLQLKLKKSKEEIERLKKNIARAETKTKSLTTRIKTYRKKINTNMRQIEKMEKQI